MKSSIWKAKLEKGFGQMGLSIYAHPWIWLLSCVLLIGLMASQLVHIKQDTSIEGYLKKGDPAIERFNQFKNVFGKDEVFIITVAVDEIFNQDFVNKMRAFHEQLEAEVPYVERVDSLANARFTYGEDDTMYIEDLLPEYLPEDPQQLQTLKDYLKNSEAYNNYLISEDQKVLVGTVRLLPFIFQKDEDGNQEQLYIEDAQLKEAIGKVNEVMDDHRGILSDDIRVTGSISMAVYLSTVMGEDFGKFTGLALLLIGTILYFIFRRISGVIMPLVIMLLGVVVTISLMAIQNSPLQVATSILPSFLLAVCVGDSIHLLTIFYKEYDKGASKQRALAYSLEHTGLAIFFTSITTAAGLASFSFSEIAPIAALGYYGAVGSIVAFVLTVLILPTLISLLPLKRKTLTLGDEHADGPVDKEHSTKLQKILLWFAGVSVKYAKSIVAIGLILFAGSIYFVSQLNFSHAPVTWLPEDHPVRQDHDFYDHMIGGTLPLEIVIDTGKKRGINDAQFLQTLDAIQKDLNAWQEPAFSVSKVIAVTDIVKESHRALNGNAPEYYSIPDDSELIAQELFLVELDKPQDLYQMIDKDYQVARVTVLIPSVDAFHILKFIGNVESYLDAQLEPLGVDYYFTGVTPVLGSTFAKMIVSTAESYAIAGMAITVMMILLIGSLKLGLLSMIPSLLPILIVLALVSIAGIPLDILTMLVGSIAIGLTVDDNVHFMHSFRRVYFQTGDAVKAIDDTLLSTGRAMLITSIVLSVGFFIYTQSGMLNMKLFGVVTASCIILALFATFLLAPALMVLSHKSEKQ